MKQLYELQNNEDFSTFVLIKSADIRIARNGNPFIAFSFQDQSGSMDGMYWSATDDEIKRFQAGKVVFLRGRRDTYNGQPQVRIEALRLAEAGEPNDPTLYVERANVDQEALKEELDNALFLIKDPQIARVVRKILHDIDEDFFTFPAAKRNHHAVAGGLIQHTMTMVRIGRALLDVYDNINPSLLIGGIILHDIGKTIELSGPISTEYTLKGQLIGHIVIMSEMIDDACSKLSIDPESESILLLKHVILAHHGKQEWGSPVPPRLLEAELVHYIDNLDASVTMILQALEQTKEGEFSPPVYAMDRRTFYKPKK